jgi:hypothetical protein
MLHGNIMTSQLRNTHGSHAAAPYLRKANHPTLGTAVGVCIGKRITDMASTKGKRGFIRKAVDAMIAGHTRRATRYANGALLRLDSETLRTLGYDKAELRKRPSGYHPL